MLLTTSATAHSATTVRLACDHPPRAAATSRSTPARSAAATPAPAQRRLSPASVAPAPNRRATLRDLYTFGLVSVFRRDSVLRLWEPLRETPRLHRDESAD